jgi:hypothetical protein
MAHIQVNLEYLKAKNFESAAIIFTKVKVMQHFLKFQVTIKIIRF